MVKLPAKTTPVVSTARIDPGREPVTGPSSYSCDPFALTRCRCAVAAPFSVRASCALGRATAEELVALVSAALAMVRIVSVAAPILGRGRFVRPYPAFLEGLCVRVRLGDRFSNRVIGLSGILQVVLLR